MIALPADLPACLPANLPASAPAAPPFRRHLQVEVVSYMARFVHNRDMRAQLYRQVSASLALLAAAGGVQQAADACEVLAGGFSGHRAFCASWPLLVAAGQCCMECFQPSAP